MTWSPREAASALPSTFAARRYRKANAYEALDHLLATALDKSETLRMRLADYHKASPELAHWLSRWQADDAKT